MTKSIQLICRNRKIIYLFVFLMSIFYCINLLNSDRNLAVPQFKKKLEIIQPSSADLTKLSFVQFKDILNFLYINDVFLLDIEILSNIQFKNLTHTSNLNPNSMNTVETFPKLKSFVRNQKNKKILLGFGALISFYSKITQVYLKKKIFLKITT